MHDTISIEVQIVKSAEDVFRYYHIIIVHGGVSYHASLPLCLHLHLRGDAILLQFLILELALQFLGFGHLAYCLAKIVLIDGISVILDGEQATAPC